jgi:DNA polymerase-3 subunit epsilon
MSNTRSGQLSFEDLGQPLVSTTFVIVDLETTGGSPATDGITEVGAVKVRGGETIGTFSTLVNPGRAIPPTITLLTGITESMVVKAPRIEAVLPSLLEFIGDAVVVGHNVRFDVGFLQAALHRAGRAPLTSPTVDTVALARRLVRDQVPNCKLGTLAEHLRLSHTPNHRALDDAITTAELLHLLIDRAGRLGVTGLDDLLALPTMAGHPQADKLRLTARLPRRPGVYLFRTAAGDVLYVGKATDLRTRVRSYFSTDDRKKVGPLLKRTERIDHKVCSSVLEAEVLEGRLIRHLDPPYNQAGTRWRAYPYLKVRTSGSATGLTVTRDLPQDGPDEGTTLLGPFTSSTMVRSAVQGLESVLPLRRRPKGGSITTSSPEVAAAAATTALTALTSQPELAIVPLTQKMAELAEQERFEDAAGVRDQMVAFTDLLRATRRREQLVRVDRMVLTMPDGGRAEVRRGVLWRTWTVDDGGLVDAGNDVEMRPELPDPSQPLPRALADELATTSAWLDRHGADLRVEHVEGTWVSVLPALPDFRSVRSAKYDVERERAANRPPRISRRLAG